MKDYRAQKHWPPETHIAPFAGYYPCENMIDFHAIPDREYQLVDGGPIVPIEVLSFPWSTTMILQNLSQ